MQPVNYEKHCATCHTLQFDRRFSESAPHKEPKVVYDFVLQKLTAYIAAHPAEIPLVDEPDKRLPTPSAAAARSQCRRMGATAHGGRAVAAVAKILQGMPQPELSRMVRCSARGGEIRHHNALAAARRVRSRSASDGAMRVVSRQGEHQPRNVRRPDPWNPNLPAMPSLRARTRRKRAASNATPITIGARKSRWLESIPSSSYSSYYTRRNVMKVAAILPALTLVAAMLPAQKPAPKPGTVDGIVINSVTGEPIKKANVSLGGKYTATTDAAGRFHFDNVASGAYAIGAEKDGFQAPNLGRGAAGNRGRGAARSGCGAEAHSVRRRKRARSG